MSDHGGCPNCDFLDEMFVRKWITRSGHVKRRIICRKCGTKRNVYEVSDEEFHSLYPALQNSAERAKMQT